MGTTTMGVKLDDATRERIKSAASRIDRTPHWLIKQAIFNYLEIWRTTRRRPSCRPCSPGPPTKAMTPANQRKSPISRSSNSPSRSCRAVVELRGDHRHRRRPEPTRYRCCWSRPVCRSRWANRRTSWRISWRKTAQPENRQRPRRHGRACCRSSPLFA